MLSLLHNLPVKYVIIHFCKSHVQNATIRNHFWNNKIIHQVWFPILLKELLWHLKEVTAMSQIKSCRTNKGAGGGETHKYNRTSS